MRDLGLERRAKPFDLAAELAQLHRQPAEERAGSRGGERPEVQPAPATDAALVGNAGGPTSGE